MESLKKIVFVRRNTNTKNKIICYPNETYFLLKRRLCKEIDIDERQIVLYDERLAILNDNVFVELNLQSIQYDVGDQIDTMSIKICNNFFGVPRWVLINSNATVEQLKNEISNYQQDGLQTFLFDENGEMLENNRPIKSYKLKNDSKIKVWRGPNLLVNLKFEFYLKDFGNIPTSSTLQCSIIDSVSEVKNRISEEISPGNALNLALITDCSYWQDDKRLIDYPIKQEGTEVFVVDLQMRKDITIKDEKCGKAHDADNTHKDQSKNVKYAKAFNGEDRSRNKIIVHRYKTNNEIIKKKKVLKYSIVSHFLLNKINSNKFVQLVTMFEKDKYFYIATEYMAQGSLEDMYSEKQFTNHEIINYSIQICEALNFMHSNKFMHRNLTCSSVLVDNNNNIKLTNFHLTKYLFNATSEQLLEGILGSKIDTRKCWMAPEVLRNEPYGLKSDIWSLAVTVLEMFTHDRPYPDVNVLRATNRIVTENTIVYDRNFIPEFLHDFLDRILRTPHEERPSAKQCIQLLKAIQIN